MGLRGEHRATRLRASISKQRVSTASNSRGPVCVCKVIWAPRPAGGRRQGDQQPPPAHGAGASAPGLALRGQRQTFHKPLVDREVHEQSIPHGLPNVYFSNRKQAHLLGRRCWRNGTRRAPRRAAGRAVPAAPACPARRRPPGPGTLAPLPSNTPGSVQTAAASALPLPRPVLGDARGPYITDPTRGSQPPSPRGRAPCPIRLRAPLRGVLGVISRNSFSL